MRVLLVHGAWGSAAGWAEVVEELAARGLPAAAIDLPGHGPNEPASGTYGLAECTARVVASLERSGPALLVGHSMGGMVISAAAERRPELVRRLLYVAAFLPCDGESLLAIKRREPETIGPAVRRHDVPGTTVLDPALAGPILFQDATAAQRARGLARLRPQSNRVQTEAVRLSPERFGRVQRDYALCTADRTVGPGLQRAMCEATPVERLWTLECGHFPQLTQPEALAGIIATAAGS